MHAARLARALGIRNVIVPHGAGVGSAIGLLNDRRHHPPGSAPRRRAEAPGQAVRRHDDLARELRFAQISGASR
jgi:N-methylhydantoinase A/oxoprolinase/acetone carboxylase beta subunit